ncbi:PKD domain-containing protein [Candidatus Amoebophilus asiaticus]|nr:PKD domain-containing protein [Candidatus Amoebophilus asiaticus]
MPNIIGTGPQSLTGSGLVGKGKLPNININKASGTLTLSSVISVGTNSNWTFTQGNIDASTNNSNVVFTRSNTITGSHTLHNVEFNAVLGSASYVISTGTELTATGALTFSGTQLLLLNNGIINAKGDIIVTNTGVLGFGGSAIIKINGTANQTLSSTVAASEGLLPNITIDKPGDTLFLSGTISVGRNWTYITGNVDASTNNSTVVFKGVFVFKIDDEGTTSTMVFNNVSILSATRKVTGTLDIDGTFLIDNASTLNADVQTMQISGNWENNGILNGQLGTVIFDGSTALSGSGPTNFNNISITGSLISSPGNINIGANWVNSGSFSSNNGTVTFIGSGSQIITKSAGSETFHNIIMNNSGAGLTLLSPVDISNSITFIDGNINTNSTNSITIKDNATVTGASNISFVSGTVTKIGDDAFSFPTGKNSNYQTIAISAPSSITDAFTAEYFDIQQTFGFNKEATLDSLSSCEHWILTRDAGTSSVTVTLGWNSNSCDIPSDLSKIHVARFNGTQWIDLGNGGTTGDSTIGSVVTMDPTNALGPFTFGISSIDTTEILCGTDIILQLQFELDPNLQLKIDLQEEIIANYIQNKLIQSNTLGVDEFVIPVVVHVIHPTNDFEGVNITYNQILSQIDALNAAYQATNTGVATGIRFCLAQIPSPLTLLWANGNTEPGVMRYPDDVLTNNQMTVQGAIDLLAETHPTSAHFPFDKYLNIWVVRSINGIVNGGIQGYAPLPILSETGSGFPLDGVVIKSNVFGDNTNCPPTCFNLQAGRDQGKILVHEVGHYFRLYHTFQTCIGTQDPGSSDDCEIFPDYVCDTPPCKQPGSTGQFCASGTENSCTENITYSNYAANLFRIDISATDAFDLIEDYMYYAKDPCYKTFSQGQIDRMQAFIITTRSNLTSLQNLNDRGVASTGGCIDPLLVADFTVDPLQICVGDVVTFTTPTGPGFSANSWDWDFGDGTTLIGTTNPSPTHTYGITGPFTVTLTAYDGINIPVTETKQIFISPCTPITSSQGNWYFGSFCAIDFSSGLPIPNNSAFVAQSLQQIEGCVTESDPSTGNLLYYSDGVNVWNNNHVVINSGNPLPGHQSTSQYISVLSPSNPNQYYLFIPPVADGIDPPFYSIIDISGTGSVAAPVALPLPIGINSVSEHVTTVPHCNGIDYWIIFHGYSPDGRFYVYRLSDQGITNADMTPNIPDVYPTSGNFSFLALQGNLKASPDGTRLALATIGTNSNGLAIYDFNNSTGEINQELVFNQADAYYGCSFSPLSDLLYATKAGGLFQYDMLGNEEEIIPSFGVDNYKGVQLGPDNRIYITRAATQFLSSLDVPDNQPCPAFNFEAVDFSPIHVNVQVTMGLPNMIDAEKPTPPAPDFTVNFASCFDIEFTVDPCWATYAVEWDFGDGTICGPGRGSITTCPNTAGTFQNPTHSYSTDGSYDITMTLSIGSSTLSPVTKTISIQSISAPNILGLSTVCEGEVVDYLIIPETGFTYDWTIAGGVFSNGQTTTSGNLVNVIWSPSGTGILSLLGNNPNPFCPDVTNSLTVTINPSPSVSISSIDDCNSTCIGEATAVVTGGTVPFTFDWQPGSQTTQSISGLCPDNYTVLVLDANSCSGSESVIITEHPPLSTTTSSIDVSCNGGSDGAVDLTVSGGTPPYTFAWSNGATTEDILGITAGTYTVVISYANCSFSESVIITEPLSPIASTIITNVSCNGGSDGAIDLTVSGATPPYTFSWSTGATTEDISGLPVGIYTIEVIDGNGCMANEVITITEPTLLISSTISTNVSCNGGSDGAIDLTVSGGTLPYTFSWSNGATTEDLTGITAGPYTVAITDNNGCNVNATTTITEPTLISTSTTITNVSCNGGSDGAIDLTVSGGTLPYTFSWSNGGTTEDISGLSVGNYTVLITDANGCTANEFASVAQPTLITTSVVSTDVSPNAGVIA